MEVGEGDCGSVVVAGLWLRRVNCGDDGHRDGGDAGGPGWRRVAHQQGGGGVVHAGE